MPFLGKVSIRISREKKMNKMKMNKKQDNLSLLKFAELLLARVTQV
jgi:hypothetical protein